MALSGSNHKQVKLHSASGRVVASVDRAGTLSKRVSGARHMLRKPPAWCFDVVVLEQAAAVGCWRLEVTDTDTDKIYTCTLAEFRAGAFELNRGFGAQLALPLERWHTAADGLQLDLWGARGG